MDIDPKNPGETTTPPVDPSVETTTASESVTNPVETTTEQSVPYDRFQKVNNERRELEERAQKAEAELESLRQSATTSEDDELDPDVEKLLEKFAQKRGLVTKSELEQQQFQAQVRKDVADLTAEYAKTGVPFDDKAVYQYAKDNGIQLTSKASLRAVYREMNFDKLVQNAQLSAIDKFKNGGGQGESSGSSSETPPADTSKMTAKERRDARWAAAREKINKMNL